MVSLSVILALSALSLAGGAVPAPPFRGEEARRWVVRQCELGPRVPGTPAHAAWLRMVHAYFDSLQVPVEEGVFRHPSPLGPDTLKMTNLMVSYRPDTRPRLLLGAHWDSRPWADEDPDSVARTRPVLGANDGASGVAVLLVLGRILRETPPPLGVDLVFFDGEDLGRKEHEEEFCLGSQWMADHWVGAPPDWVVVLDMVGSQGMELGQEGYSREYAPQLLDLVFRVAREKGFHEWNPESRLAVVDDHLPFLRLGIPAILLIGFNDPNWHTLRDDPSRISSQSLGRVGEVVTTLIYGRFLVP